MAGELHILVVDDNEALNETLCMMLDILGHRAVAARTGGQAIDYARDQAPDVVLMDLILPDLSGFATCEILRGFPALAKTCFIAHSGHNGRDYIDAARDAGFSAYLVKPVSLEVLERVLASLPRD